MERICGFDPQALTSLTHLGYLMYMKINCFDPQALTSLTDWLSLILSHEKVSIHRLLRA